jgi:SulP family sulfate permease
MIRRQHDPDAELVAQGLGNVVGPFFGAITATGAIARTAANIRGGARSPVAALVHSGFLLLATILLAPLLGKLPMASLAALLLVVAWNMSEARHVVRTLQTAPRSDGLVLLTCLGLTVLFDMVVAVMAGVLLAALLFMRRMMEVTQAQLVSEPHRKLRRPIPPGVVLYEIAGPLFFGAAARAMRALHSVDTSVRAVVLDLRSVPALDATGLVALDSAVDRLTRADVPVVLAGVREQPLRALLRAGWRDRRPLVEIRRDFDRGVALAGDRAQAEPADRPQAP